MNKVFIPGRYAGESPTLVNIKQARRILIMRQKKNLKCLKQLQKGIYVNPKTEGGKFSQVRVKRQDRIRLACARKRVNGLFVNKTRERLLEKGLSDEEVTEDPD